MGELPPDRPRPSRRAGNRRVPSADPNGSPDAAHSSHTPLFFLGGLLLGLVVDLVVPAHYLDASTGVRVASAALLVTAGVLTVGASQRALRAVGTTSRVHRPTTALASGGPYRFSRHPMYLVFALLDAALSLVLPTIWPLLLLPFVLMAVERWSMLREERYLEGRFGDEYRAYATRVRRWV